MIIIRLRTSVNDVVSLETFRDELLRCRKETIDQEQHEPCEVPRTPERPEPHEAIAVHPGDSGEEYSQPKEEQTDSAFDHPPSKVIPRPQAKPESPHEAERSRLDLVTALSSGGKSSFLDTILESSSPQLDNIKHSSGQL